MPLTTNPTVNYSEPNITRTDTSTEIEYDVVLSDSTVGWELIRIEATTEGELLISNRETRGGTSGHIDVPRSMRALFAAEVQRLAGVIA